MCVCVCGIKRPLVCYVCLSLTRLCLGGDLPFQQGDISVGHLRTHRFFFPPNFVVDLLQDGAKVAEEENPSIFHQISKKKMLSAIIQTGRQKKA